MVIPILKIYRSSGNIFPGVSFQIGKHIEESTFKIDTTIVTLHFIKWAFVK